MGSVYAENYLHRDNLTQLRVELPAEDTYVEGDAVTWTIPDISQREITDVTYTVRDFDITRHAGYKDTSFKPLMVFKNVQDLGQKTVYIKKMDGTTLATLTGNLLFSGVTYVCLRLTDCREWELA
jgi:hypothetical protein